MRRPTRRSITTDRLCEAMESRVMLDTAFAAVGLAENGGLASVGYAEGLLANDNTYIATAFDAAGGGFNLDLAFNGVATFGPDKSFDLSDPGPWDSDEGVSFLDNIGIGWLSGASGTRSAGESISFFVERPPVAGGYSMEGGWFMAVQRPQSGDLGEWITEDVDDLSLELF